MEFVREGSREAVIDEARAGELVDWLLTQLRQRGPLRRVLLLPPDITRSHSWAGTLAGMFCQRLHPAAEVAVLPTTGTHVPMTDAEIARMYPGIPRRLFFAHDWRSGVVPLGQVPAEVIRRVSEGKLEFAINVSVDRLLVEKDWDVILSIGQLVPHEVAGIANHNKNVFIGAGGSDLINKSHWLGAVFGIERIMGRAKTPVREVLDYASANLAKHLPIVYLLTVRGRDEQGQIVTRGLYAGDDGDCFRQGAELCRRVNLDQLERTAAKVVVYLDPLEYKSTWLGNKAIYRTRMAMADGGELIVVAPGVSRFGEDAEIDRLIRLYGYRGTSAILEQVRRQPELAANLSAAAHLIHGSSEGRFAITYCPGKLSREDIEGVGFGYNDCDAMLRRYPPDKLQTGWNTLADGEEIFFISNPGLGLWGTAERFGKRDPR
jgi:nickel-dependent lactate racemase